MKSSIASSKNDVSGDGASDDLLSRLLRAHDAEEVTRFTDQELRDAVVTLLLAGHETTANALAWTFYLISQSPLIEDRLVREARQEPRKRSRRVTRGANGFFGSDSHLSVDLDHRAASRRRTIKSVSIRFPRVRR